LQRSNAEIIAAGHPRFCNYNGINNGGISGGTINCM
jgi:hypothetical protein